MSKFLKIIISFFIVTLICTGIYFLFYLNIFKINGFNFINNLQESKINRELADISIKIDNFFDNQTKINNFLTAINLKKFEDKKKILNINDELLLAEKFILSDDYLLKIKFYDNFGKVIFSTDSDEKVIRGNFITFSSKDRIERRDDFYSLTKDKNSFILENNNVILKKNIISSNKSIGIMLFYYNNFFIIDLQRKSGKIQINKPYFTDKKIIIINIPEFLNEEELSNFKIEKNKYITVKYKDNLIKEYRIFTYELKKNDLIIGSFVDNNTFIVEKRIKFILFFISIYTLYLLVLALLLHFERSKFERLRGEASLFTSELIEEIITAKNRDELEKIKKQLKVKKENVFKNLFNDNNIKEKDIKELDRELNFIFTKINDLVEQKMRDHSGSGNLDKVEQLLEKFVSTIAEKGIQINTPLNINQTILKEKTKGSLDEKLEEVEEAGEVEEVEEINELETSEETGKAEKTNEIEEAEEVEEINELETSEATEKAEKTNEIEEAEEVEEINELETSEATENAEKVNEIKEAEKAYNNLETSEIEEVPKIPQEFYNGNQKDDVLAKAIQEIANEKSELDLLLENIYVETKADKLSLLINVKKKNAFIQINQIGNESKNVEKVVLDENNILVKHIYSTHRMVYVANIKKFKDICDNPVFLKSFSGMKSLFIYPFKIFGKIRSVILLFFREEKNDSLEKFVDIFEKYKTELRKNLIKII